ncbi:phosphoribosylformylglycinamidine synthase-associated small membrane protein [Roseibium sp.]
MDEDARKAMTFLALKAAIFILVPALAALLAVFFLL